jgi:hypothetical protein
MNACLASFALEGLEGLRTSLAAFEKIGKICEKASFSEV